MQDLTPLLRIFYLMERAFSSFFNAARRFPEIDPVLAEWLVRERKDVISSLVSAERVYHSSPYDMIKFFNHRIAETSKAAWTEKLEEAKGQVFDGFAKAAVSRLQGLSTEKAADKGIKRDGAWRDALRKDFEAIWDKTTEGAIKKAGLVMTDPDLGIDVPDRKRREQDAGGRSSDWVWRYKRNMIEDFQDKLMFLIKARNSTMHGYLPRHATLDIIIETLADVFNSMSQLLGPHVRKVPEGHLFMLGPLELRDYADGRMEAQTWTISRGGKGSTTFLRTSFNIRHRDSVPSDDGLMWPTLAETDRVWVSEVPLIGTDRPSDSSLEELRSDLRNDIMKDKTKDKLSAGVVGQKLSIGLSRFVPTRTKGEFLSAWRWTENSDRQSYVCFWFAADDG